MGIGMWLAILLLAAAAILLGLLIRCLKKHHNPCAELEGLLIEELEHPKPPFPTPVNKSSEPKPPECPGCPGGHSALASAPPGKRGAPGIRYEAESEKAKYEITRKRTDSPGCIEYCVTVRKK
jgi:hypothetical protein